MSDPLKNISGEKQITLNSFCNKHHRKFKLNQQKSIRTWCVCIVSFSSSHLPIFLVPHEIGLHLAKLGQNNRRDMWNWRSVTEVSFTCGGFLRVNLKERHVDAFLICTVPLVLMTKTSRVSHLTKILHQVS